mgnify:CR=1 FL=1
MYVALMGRPINANVLARSVAAHASFAQSTVNRLMDDHWSIDLLTDHSKNKILIFHVAHMEIGLLVDNLLRRASDT